MKNCRHGGSESYGQRHLDGRLYSSLWENPWTCFLSHPQSGMASSPGREPSHCLHFTLPAGAPSTPPFPGATCGTGAQPLPRSTRHKRHHVHGHLLAPNSPSGPSDIPLENISEERRLLILLLEVFLL